MWGSGWLGLPRCHSGKESACNARDTGDVSLIPGLGRSLVWEDPLEKKTATDSSILAWKIHGQRSLVGYSPWGCKELGTTEHSTESRWLLNVLMWVGCCGKVVGIECRPFARRKKCELWGHSTDLWFSVISFVTGPFQLGPNKGPPARCQCSQ